ncbi:dithiol-disulfide isomerase [Paenibacillus sp. PK3_47]|uniref:DsbA family protein n=1 Tax=Paenibacillus sp. PK3_47 TaxID=2072642 RepID=UPI00201D7C28|nr:DsbA family protein [Paenibacillus sp. PK3_47]UQZ36920.1 dithiol-disulfide isomerase [Paenibacillus sp. PK3_47]
MSSQNMMCDLETGVCGVADAKPIEAVDLNQTEKKVTLYYFTDPICSHCWALEPVLNRFIQEYGQYFDLKVNMGGLLAGWNGFSDGSNGIQKPSDVAGHWREVGGHSRMPIDGSLWITNPILSSYPPSRVFKVIQSNQPGKEHEFLRRAREAVFAFNQNIGEEAVLTEIVNQMGLDGEKIVEDSATPAAQEMLEEDFQLASRLGVRGFPTLIMVNEDQKGVKIVGTRSLDTYREGLQQIVNNGLRPRRAANLAKVLEEGHILFAKEIEVMYDIEQNEVKAFIEAELPQHAYRSGKILNELYIQSH